MGSHLGGSIIRLYFDYSYIQYIAIQENSLCSVNLELGRTVQSRNSLVIEPDPIGAHFHRAMVATAPREKLLI
jgi:hypothetical protein